jgi:hypothetical protein
MRKSHAIRVWLLAGATGARPEGSFVYCCAQDLDYFPAQNSTPLAFGENHPVGGKLQDRTELNLTSAAAVDSFL